MDGNCMAMARLSSHYKQKTLTSHPECSNPNIVSTIQLFHPDTSSSRENSRQDSDFQSESIIEPWYNARMTIRW